MSATLPPHVDLLDRLVANVRLAEAAHVQGWDAEAARYEQEVRGLYYQVLGYMQVPDPGPSSRDTPAPSGSGVQTATDGATTAQTTPPACTCPGGGPDEWGDHRDTCAYLRWCWEHNNGRAAGQRSTGRGVIPAAGDGGSRQACRVKACVAPKNQQTAGEQG